MALRQDMDEEGKHFSVWARPKERQPRDSSLVCRVEWWASLSTGTVTSTGPCGTANPFTSSMAFTMMIAMFHQASTSGKEMPVSSPSVIQRWQLSGSHSRDGRRPETVLQNTQYLCRSRQQYQCSFKWHEKSDTTLVGFKIAPLPFHLLPLAGSPAWLSFWEAP